MRKRAGEGRLSFIPPLMPTLVDNPPEGDGWIHEIKFDGYRSQIINDDAAVCIVPRRGLDWTAKYRDLTEAAKGLNVQNAIIDGEIIVLNDQGLSDFRALRKAITSRQQDLYFVAFDPMVTTFAICRCRTAARSCRP
jgi:ATP-dependent DNA ligase